MKAVLEKKSLKSPEKAGTYWRVICLNGPEKGTSYYLQSDRVILGRSRTADVQVKDNGASREHAELKKMGYRYILTDLASGNGTVVDGEKIKQKKLKDGDKFIIGRTYYKYEIIRIRGLLSTIGELIEPTEERKRKRKRIQKR